MSQHHKTVSSKKRPKLRQLRQLRQPRREPPQQELIFSNTMNALSSSSSSCDSKSCDLAQHVFIGAIGSISEETYSPKGAVTTDDLHERSKHSSDSSDNRHYLLLENRIQLKRSAKHVHSLEESDSDVGQKSTIPNSSDSDKDSDNYDYAGSGVSSSSDSRDSDYEISSDSNDDGEKSIDKDNSKQCHLQLIEQGLDEHLKSPICNKSTAMTQTMMMRYTRFLVWLWNLIGFSTTAQVGFNVCHLISAFIIQHSQLLPRYYTHLKETYLFKASTIIDHNENFQVLVHWYAVYRVRKEIFAVDPSQLYTINLIIKSMRKTFSRERKVEEVTSTDNTIEGLVKSRKWPVGGLQELSDAVVSQMEWARRLCVKGCIISLSIYNLFMQVFMSSLFTSKSLLVIVYKNILIFKTFMLGAIQGRVGALDHLFYYQRDELLENKFVMSSQFKTGLQYGLQPVIFSSSALELFRMYLGFIRPKCMEGPQDPLFITFSGTRLRVGRFVTAFYKRILKLNINTTRIRCIVETESAQLLFDGQISQGQRDSVLNQNGHSSITSQKYYQKRSRTRDMNFVEDVHRQLVTIDPPTENDPSSSSLINDDNDAENAQIFHPCGLSHCTCIDYRESDKFLACQFCGHGWDVHGLLSAPLLLNSVQRNVVTAVAHAELAPLSPSVSPSIFNSPKIARSVIGASPIIVRTTTPVVSNIGALHPCLNEKSSRRVTWTEKEVEIVGKWCKEYETQHGNNNNVVSNCLKYLLRDEELRQHFHPHHLMDSTRLRWGYQKYQTDSLVVQCTM